ncbi:MAG: hypothetical protein WD734_03610 [Dehalococcoidia bacterium]
MTRLLPLLLGLLVLAVVACTAVEAELEATATAAPPDHGAAFSILTDDGVHLSGRLFEHDPHRMVIYLHPYREDQSGWWLWLEEPLPDPPSAITLDFRGHGESGGDELDAANMPRDVEAVLAFARARGYEQIMLVGAGMGAAAGMVAVADDPDVPVVGLSAPTEFAELKPIEVAREFRDRLALVAARDDLSARESMRQFEEEARVPFSRLSLWQGREHGSALVHGPMGQMVRPFIQRMVDEFLPA